MPTLLIACAIVGAAPAHADDRVIAPGVSAGGVDVGGLTVDAAAARLDAALTPHLSRPVVLRSGDEVFRLTAEAAGVKLDAPRTAKRAAQVRPAPGTPAGGGVTADNAVELALGHRRLAVRAWVGQVAREIGRPARDASVTLGIRHQTIRRGKAGTALDRDAAAAAIDAVLDDAGASRMIAAPMKRVRPRVNADDLLERYGTVVTIDRATFTLRLFKRLKAVKRYGIAVGMAGLDTPAGTYRIANRQVNPAWHVPRSPWAGALQGQVIPGGAPNNPLKARWLGIAGGVGIHGTAEEWSIGSRASHGCIRMRVRDVVDLFPRVPVGATVLIK